MDTSPSSPNPIVTGPTTLKPDDATITSGPQAPKKCTHHRNIHGCRSTAPSMQQIQMQLLHQQKYQQQAALSLSNQPLHLIPSNVPTVGTIQQLPHQPSPPVQRCDRRHLQQFATRPHPYVIPPNHGHMSYAPPNEGPTTIVDSDQPSSPSAADRSSTPVAAAIYPSVQSQTNVTTATSIITSPSTVVAPCTAAAPSSNASPVSLEGPVQIQIQTGLVNPVNAALLSDRYLLMEPPKGSTMYKCIDMRLNKDLVCKVANNPCSNLLNAHFRLDGHPNVNPLLKVIQGTHQTYLMFAQSHGDLHQHVRLNKRLRENEARRLFRQMCEVVKCSHEQGIVLRDLKLRKFVFADDESQHLCLESLEDAVVLDNPDNDMLQDKRGCPAYVSPEILRHNATYSGKAADMWSLGVILYTMLVGRYPFNDSEHHTLFAKILRGQFTVPDCLSSKARCMIRSLLRREPSERISSEDLLLHPWMTHDESRDNTSGISSSPSPSTSSSSSSSNLSAASDQCVPEVYVRKGEDGSPDQFEMDN